MLKCYNKETKSFEHLLSLSQNKQKALAESVMIDVNIILEEFEKLQKSPNWWQRKVNKAKSKSEEQNVLDGLLKVALPIIWHQNELFKDYNYTDKRMLKYLPNGKEIAAEMILEGKWPIKVWKNSKRDGHQWLKLEFQDKSEVDDKIRFSTFKSIPSFCKYLKI